MSEWRTLLANHRALLAYYALTSAMLALPMAAMTLLLNRDLGMAAQPERVSAYYAAVFATSVLKPLFGALSDALPLAGWRRRGVIAPGCAVAAASTAALGVTVRGVAGLYAAGVAAALGFCAAEAAADGALVEAACGADDVAALQVTAMTVRTAASAAASVLGALLLRAAPPRAVICVAACFGVAAALVSLCVPDGAQPDRVAAEPESPAPASAAGGDARAWLRARLRAAASLAHRAWRHLLRVGVASALLFALGAAPRSDDAYAAFVATGLRPPLSDWQVGVANACDTNGALLGTLAYGVVSSGGRSTRVLLAAGVAVGAAGSLLRAAAPTGCLGVPPPLFVALAALCVSATTRAAFMPQLVMCAQLAPQGGEAAGFAALVAVADGGALASAGLTAALTAALRVGSAPGRSWRNLPPLVCVCAAARLLPLLLLPLLREPALQAARLRPPVVGADGDELTAPLLDGGCSEDDQAVL